jgi:hypothetical protein
MSYYTKKQKANQEHSGKVSVESGGELDIESGGALKVAGVTVLPSAAEMNLNDLSYQLLVADGPITVKNGLCAIAKTVAGAVAATLANPTAGTDDFKRLTIVSAQAQANTVTLTGGFGDGGSGEDVCTFSGAIGDCLSLMAYGGKWYITGSHQATIA